MHRAALTRIKFRHPVNVEMIEQAPLGARIADRVTLFLGSWRFLVIQTILVVIWIAGNVVLLFHFDPYPFILLNLAFSTQAAYAAPLILLAGNRSAQRDRLTLEHAADRSRPGGGAERPTARREQADPRTGRTARAGDPLARAADQDRGRAARRRDAVRLLRLAVPSTLDATASSEEPPHDHRRRRQAAPDLPRRPLGRIPRPARRRQPGRPLDARPARPSHATEAQYEEAVEAAVAAFEVTRKLPAYERGRILREISAGLQARREELGRLIALEAGKPIRDALVEVDRATLTFRLGAEEAERMTGELIPLDLLPVVEGPDRDHPALPDRPDRRRSARSTSRSTWPPTSSRRRSRRATRSCSSRRPRTRSTMLAVAEIIEAAGVPAGSVSILPMTRELGDRMVADERFKLLTFTGSPSVGWRMKERAGKKKVVLELGGNAGVIVDQTADLDWAVKRCLVGGVQPTPARSASASSGCSSTRTSGTTFMDRVRRGRARRSRSATRSIRRPTSGRWSTQPRRAGRSAGSTRRSRSAASSLLGGRADGTFFPPTILTDVPLTAQVCSNEAFAPLVVAFPFRDLDEAIARSTTRCSGCRPASSPTTWPAPGGRSPSSRSAGSSSTTSRPTGSTTCRTAGSRTPASVARACAGRSRT